MKNKLLKIIPLESMELAEIIPEQKKELTPEETIKLLMEIVTVSRRLAYGVQNHLNEKSDDSRIMMGVLLKEYHAKVSEVERKAIEETK